MARQRVVYVIEVKTKNARGWTEVGCEHNKIAAKQELRLWKISNPGDEWRITPYYPQEEN